MTLANYYISLCDSFSEFRLLQALRHRHGPMAMAAPPPRNPPGTDATCGGFNLISLCPLPSTCSYGTPDSTIKYMDGRKSTAESRRTTAIRRSTADRSTWMNRSMTLEIPNRVSKQTAQWWSKGNLRSSYPFAIALLPPAFSARLAPWSVDVRTVIVSGGD